MFVQIPFIHEQQQQTTQAIMDKSDEKKNHQQNAYEEIYRFVYHVVSLRELREEYTNMNCIY